MTAPTPPVLTLLYVPGDQPERVSKAFASKADVVAIDLEDAVAPGRKRQARENLKELLGAGEPPTSTQVRINPRGSGWHEDDLASIAALPEAVAVRLPKATSREDIAAVKTCLGNRPIHALIESPLGVENAFEIAQSGVSSIALGEADLRSGLNVPAEAGDSPGLFWARSRIVNAAAAAGLAPPMMSVYTGVHDLIGLRESSVTGRKLGFLGRNAIHPKQLDVIREAFCPDEDELGRALGILNRIEGAHADGSGTVVLEDGSFLDVAMVESARRTVAIADM